jgi:hypothetical protein
MSDWPLQSNCEAFYGNPYSAGWLQANTVDVVCPWQLYVGTIPVAHITIHKKCADSLRRVLANIWEAAGHDPAKIKEWHCDRYDGSYNLRPMRGGHNTSMHGFAAAIDFDAADNPQHAQKHFFTADHPLVKAFEAEGWIWGGRWSSDSIDAMHVQAALVRPREAGYAPPHAPAPAGAHAAPPTKQALPAGTIVPMPPPPSIADAIEKEFGDWLPSIFRPRPSAPPAQKKSL